MNRSLTAVCSLCFVSVAGASAVVAPHPGAADSPLSVATIAAFIPPTVPKPPPAPKPHPKATDDAHRLA